MNGLDLVSPITAVKEGYALRLDDWVCRQDGLHVRRGSERVAALGRPVTALLSYPGHLIARDDGDWSGALVANPGGTHLVMANGASAPQHYNGSSWSPAAITGVDPSALSIMITHQRRIFAVEKNSLRLWYLGLDAIGGPAQPIFLEAQCQRAGHIVAIASTNANGGRGRESQLMIVTSAGELIAYSGTNPDDNKTWSLMGVWDVPLPVGPRCFAHIGGTLALLTVQGLLSVPAVLAVPDDLKPNKALSNKIAPMLADDTPLQVLESGSAELTLIHTGSGHQFVKSSTGGWSRWTGFSSAMVWCEHEGALYFGDIDGNVRKYGSDTDEGTPIRSFSVDAFSQFKSPTKKRFTRIRPLYHAAHPYMPRIELLTDYRNPPETFLAANIDDRYWQWSDVSWPRQPMPWVRDVSAHLQPWRSVAGRGISASMMMSLQTRTPIIWTGSEIAYDAGGRL